MSSADVLRTPGLAQALSDGAAALDQVPQLQATAAGLQTSLDAATATIAQLQQQLAATAPEPPRPARPPQHVVPVRTCPAAYEHGQRDRDLAGWSQCSASRSAPANVRDGGAGR